MKHASTFFSTFLLSASVALQAAEPTKLRCEYRDNPLGIDVPQPRLSWELMDVKQEPLRGEKQTAYQILVASSEALLGKDQGDLWDSGKVNSDQQTQLPYAGNSLTSSKQVFWKMRVWDQGGQVSSWSPAAQWTMGLLSAADWNASQWIGLKEEPPMERVHGGKSKKGDPISPEETEQKELIRQNKFYSVRLRREFTVKPGLQRAVFHVCGLGQYDLQVNGQEASAERLTPGWTDYNKTCLYDSLDLTPRLKTGANTLGITLAGGMYRVPMSSRYAKFTGSYGALQVIGQLELGYSDGTREMVATDAQWQVGPSPVTFSTIYAGEDYDARLEQTDWSKPGFKTDDQWQPVAVLKGSGGQMRGITSSAWPIQDIELLKTVAVKEISPTVKVYDLGQNAPIVPRLTVSGLAGASVKITPAELTDHSGKISDPMCKSNSYCVYTLTGTGTEIWRPQFYYRGARYLRVETVPSKPGGALPVVAAIDGIVEHSAAPVIGEFSCSNELFNRIYTLVRWAQRANMMSVLTDCPTREKLGWLEETHLNGPALRYNFNLNPLFAKIVSDMGDAQTPTGLVPDVAPEYVLFHGGFRDSPEWGSAALLVPWQQYEFTGDTSLLERAYDMMTRYEAYLGSKAKNQIVDYGLGDWYDIGPKPPGQAQLTPKAVTATAFYFYNAWVLGQTATRLGKTEDAKKYALLSEEIKKAFQAQFFNAETNQVATGSQCANAIALVMGLVPEDHRSAVLENVVKNLHDVGLTAGDVGYRYLLRALAEGGRSDVIYELNNQSEKPGYGYQLKQGATSLTEAWNAGGGASQNHFMLGQINEWLFRDLAGIQFDPQRPGFQHILIKPSVVGDLSWVQAHYDSPYGRILSNWKREGDQLSMEITIPPNTTATVFVPAKDPSRVTESGHPTDKAVGVKFLRMENNAAVYAVGSGVYRFHSTLF